MPETLHALIAARLDGLTAEERRVVQDGAVLGKTFTQPALAALSGLRPTTSSSRCSPALVRKEVLSLQADPRSPEHGQYGFLQDLVATWPTRRCPARAPRPPPGRRRLPGAGGPDDDEIVEVLASHYLDAYTPRPTRTTRARSGRGPAGSRAPASGPRRWARPARRSATTPRPPTSRTTARAGGLLDQAGEMAVRTATQDDGRELAEQARALRGGGGPTAPPPGSRCACRASSRLRAASERRSSGWSGPTRCCRRDEPSEDFAMLTARLAASLYFTGDVARASDWPSRRSTSPRRWTCRRCSSAAG